MSKAIIKVGCCSFTVARPKYFQTFLVVEIQQSFYQPPKQDTVKRWRDKAPADFEFTLKACQLITHEASSPTYRRLKEPLSQKQRGQVGSFRATEVVRWAWETTLQMARLLVADKVVFQCPASFVPTNENMERMREFFSNINREGVTCIWEPRGSGRMNRLDNYAGGLTWYIAWTHSKPNPSPPACTTIGYTESPAIVTSTTMRNFVTSSGTVLKMLQHITCLTMSVCTAMDCASRSCSSSSLGPLRMSNIEQGTSKFEIRHSIFDIRSRLGQHRLNSLDKLYGNTPHGSRRMAISSPADVVETSPMGVAPAVIGFSRMPLLCSVFIESIMYILKAGSYYERPFI
jgi:hypothetical protein